MVWDSPETVAPLGGKQFYRARLTFDVTSGQQVTVRLTGNTMGFTTVKLLKPNGTEQTSGSNSLGSFNLATQTLSTPGTYTVETWHERFGSVTHEVTIDADHTAMVTFTFGNR